MKKILVLVNDVTTVLQFRRELIKALVEKGYQVIVSVPESSRIVEIEELGASVVVTEVARHGKNPLKDYLLYLRCIKLLKEIKPDIVFTFTIKPNVYGGMACGKLKIPYVCNVTGLGVVGDKGILQKLMLWLYKKGVKKAQCVLFQNQANRQFFIDKKIVKGDTALLPGSGVNVDKFSYLEFPKELPITITFVGRIIRDKGVFELAEAIQHFQDRKDVRFMVVGDVEYGAVNPFIGLPNVECVGFHKDVKPFLKTSHAIVLPSYHEGMANVLLEGASCGRVILASNIPGCQESFDEGVTGFGFSAQNAQSLKETIEKFLSLSIDEMQNMGQAGRKKMQTQFDRNFVIEKYVEQLKQRGI